MLNNKDKEKDFLKKFTKIIYNYISNDESKVVEYKSPEELYDIFDFEINEDNSDFESLNENVKRYLKYSVNTSHKHFNNQLYGGFNIAAFAGEVVSLLSNTSIATYESAPIASLMEKELIKHMSKLLNFTENEGVFVTGGSNANLIAMFSARNKCYPKIKEKGVFGLKPLSMFISEEAHYSFDNNANVLGIGADNVYRIKSNSKGEMIPEHLDEKIRESVSKGEKPFFVAVTAGTTLLGAFDDFNHVADICDKYDIWLHCDGAFGGSIILSPERGYLFKGIERVNSFSWDPHKLMNIPLVCSVILINEKKRLENNLGNLNHDYLFHDSETDSYDMGKKSIQCARKTDAVKLWFAWNYFGDKGYADRIETLFELAEYFEEKVKKDDRLELMVNRQTLMVCFRYIPKDKKNINDINLNIREQLRMNGKILINYSYLNENLCLRWVVTNADTNKKDIDKFFNIFFETALKVDAEKTTRSSLK